MMGNVLEYSVTKGGISVKFAIRYSDVIKNYNEIKKIFSGIKIDDTINITVIFDNTEERVLSDLNEQKKYAKKCKKKLQTLGIPFDHIIMTRESNLSELCNRNHIDVLISSMQSDAKNFENNEFVTVFGMSNIDELNNKVFNYIKEWNEPILDDSVEITDSPSNDKIWLKFYNKKAMNDLKRLKPERNSAFQQIKINNQDFLYETAFEINGTDTAISYYELIENVEKYKAKFIERGIGYNDVVTIMTPNVLAGAYSVLALQEIGAIPSMVHVFTKKDVLHGYLTSENSKAVVMIGMEEVYKTVKEAIKGTNVKKVITVPLTDSLSFKYRLGIKLLNSKLYKFAINISKSNGKYSLDKKQMNLKSIKNVVTQLITDFNETSGNFVAPEDEVFESLEKFLSGDFKKVESRPNKIAALMHTGGSTGTPKAALITHDNLSSNVDQFEATIRDFKRGETMITIPPIFHVLGFNNCLYMPLRSGIKVVFVPKYNKEKLREMFIKHKPEYFFAVPKIGRDLLKEDMSGVDMTKLKYMVYGGEEMDASFLTDATNLIQNNGAKIKASQSLGATEATCCVSNTFNNCNKIGSLGIPLIGLDAKIVKIKSKDDNDYENIEELGYNQVGELCFSGDSIMQGYLQQEYNSSTLRRHPDGKIWLHTSDAGYIDENGLLYFEDRTKDMIKINGEQVYTSEIKKLVTSYPLVEKCAITCISDSEGKKKIIATITLKTNNIYSEEKIKSDIIELCKSNLIKEAVPSKIEIKEFMPETMYFKTDTRKLLEEYQAKQQTEAIQKVKIS